MKRKATLSTLSVLALILAALLVPAAQAQGCLPSKQGPYCNPGNGCNGLAELTFRVHAGDSGAHLGDVDLGCHPCSSGSSVCATVNAPGYQSHTFCVNPTASKNGRHCHWDVFLCPLATPTPPATPTPIPPPAETCDADYVALVPPAASLVTEPERPVVVGQDEEKRGVDLHVQATAGRAERHEEWWEPVCDDAGWPPCTIPDDPWHWECIDHVTEVYVDRIVYVGVNFRLGDDTIAWIEGDLAGRYPGAKVLGAYPETFILYDGPPIGAFRDTIYRYQNQDPGEYGGRVTVQTEGTPLSVPQIVEPAFSFKSWMREATIWW